MVKNSKIKQHGCDLYLADLLSIATPAPITQHGPLEPEAETYDEMVARLATSTEDPATLSLGETAALLAKYPEALLEPIADSGPRFAELLTDPSASTVCIEARVGRLLIDLARGYAMPMLKQDIFARRESEKRQDLLESPFSHSEYDVAMDNAGVRERSFA